MIGTLLSGILLERYFFQRVDSTSTALYEDRLLPAVFVYELTDHIHQRYRLAEKVHLTQQSIPTTDQIEQLTYYRQQMDALVVAFQHTYLIQDESTSLQHLTAELDRYGTVEKQLLYPPADPHRFDRLEQQLDAIRAELLHLSNIQTTVGKELLSDTESIIANAYALGQLQITVLIFCCLIALILVLSSKVVRSPIVQQGSLN
jgi:hypothetical protein